MYSAPPDASAPRRAALDALAGDPLSGTHQARLAVSAFRGEDLAAILSTLAAREALFADALVTRRQCHRAW